MNVSSVLPSHNALQPAKAQNFKSNINMKGYSSDTFEKSPAVLVNS